MKANSQSSLSRTPYPRGVLWKRSAFGLWLILWAIVIIAWLFPIRFTTLRLFLLAGVLCLWLGALGFFWNRKSVRALCLVALILSVIFLFAPGREYSREKLRREYVAALQKYDGAPYIWGGESWRGIDCSGLVRRGLIDANLKNGIATLNPHLTRTAFSLWWNDASAKAMIEEYRGTTRMLFAAPSLNAVDYARIRAGDFAVTASGVHTLAYIGDKTWIEADPNPMRVIKVRVPSRNAWFLMPVKIMRWRELE